MVARAERSSVRRRLISALASLLPEKVEVDS